MEQSNPPALVRLSEGLGPSATVKALGLQTWGGLRFYPVEVIGETRTKYRVRVHAAQIRLPGRRIARAGDEVLVPRYAVRDVPKCDTRLDHWQPGRAYGYGA